MWHWIEASSPAELITALAALILALRGMSFLEHRRTIKLLNGGLLRRVANIERALGIDSD